MNAIVERAKLSRNAALRANNIAAGGSVLADPEKVTFPAQTLPSDPRIPIADLAADLDYLVPKPLLEDNDDALQPQIRVSGTATWIDLDPGNFIFPGPVADRDWSKPYKIPRSFLAEGQVVEAPTLYEFRYIFWAGGVNDTGSGIASFGVDRTAPYKTKVPPSDRTPAAPTWPADLGPSVPIDETYLSGKPGILVKPAIPGNYEETDVYRFYFGPAPDPVRDQPVYEAPLSAAREALIPVDVFLAAPDGPNRLIYRSIDLPGNVSKISSLSQRTVAHAKDPDPATVKPPIVTLANGLNGDGLIDLADTQFDSRGVEVKVTVPTPNAISDTIIVYWGTEALGELRVDTLTELTFYAPYDTVKTVYGNTDGPVDTHISYKMFRNTRELATDFADIVVDISYIGPDPILIGLDPPRLTTTKGNDDEILEEDFNDAGITAHIDLFSDPPTEEGWLIDLFYDDLQIGDSIPLTTGQEGKTLTRNIPWATVDARGSGTKVLRYVLFTPGGNNPTDSKIKDIQVEAFPLVLDPPEVQGLAGPLRRIGCATLNFPTATNPGDGTPRRDLIVRILPNTYTVDGETITLKYEAYDTATPPVPIPGTDATATFLITGTFPVQGVIINIGEYFEDFKPAHLGTGRLTYSISRGGAGNNPTPDSLPASHIIDLDDSEARFCEDFFPTP